MMKPDHKNSLKVCLVCHGLGSGGIESFVVSLAAGLKKRKIDVRIAMALDDNGVPQFREQEMTDSGIEMFRTSDLGSVKRLFLHCVRLYRYLKSNHFDVVHSNMSYLNGLNLAVAFAAGAKIRVAHAHMTVSEQSAHGTNNIKNRVYRRIMHTLISCFANRKCGCSEQVVISSYGKNGRCANYVIDNGVDIDRFYCPERDDGKDKNIITVGRLVPMKNPELILQIMCQLKDSGYHLNWVGGGELHDWINEEIRQRGLDGYITMLGTRSDVNILLRDACVFLLPSFYEGLPIAVIEAQAAGLPCVISDIVPKKIDCGLCTFLPTSASPKVWASTIKAIASGEQPLVLDQDKLQKFSVDHMVEQVIAMYGIDTSIFSKRKGHTLIL